MTGHVSRLLYHMRVVQLKFEWSHRNLLIFINRFDRISLREQIRIGRCLLFQFHRYGPVAGNLVIRRLIGQAIAVDLLL